MSAERLDGAIGIDINKRIIVITARPRGMVIQPPVEIAVPIASLKAIMGQVMTMEAQMENGNAVLPLEGNTPGQNGIAPNARVTPGLAIAK